MDPKRHHYLAQRYLAGFAERDGRIWVFDRRTGKLRRDVPGNVGVETRLYRFEDPAGQTRSLEGFFSFLENATWPAIDRFASGADPSAADRHILAFYTAFQFTRTPRFRDNIRASLRTALRESVRGVGDEDAVEAVLAEMRSTGMTDLPSPESLRDLLPDFRHGYEMPGWGVVRLMLTTAFQLAEVLSRMSTSILFAGDGAFITTESPVIFTVPPWVPQPSLVAPGALKIVPLTQKVLVIYEDFGDSFAMFGPMQRRTDFFNATLADAAEHLIIGPSETLVAEMSEPDGPAARKVDQSPL